MVVHVTPTKELILKLHLFMLARQLIDFFEVIHVELPNEGSDLIVTKELRQHMPLQSPNVPNDDLSFVASPAYVVCKLFSLSYDELYLQDAVQFQYKIRHCVP